MRRAQCMCCIQRSRSRLSIQISQNCKIDTNVFEQNLAHLRLLRESINIYLCKCVWSCRIFAGVTVFCIAMPYQSHFPLTEAKFLLYEHYIVSCDTKKYNTRFFEQAFNQCSRLYTLENELRQSVGCLMCHTIWLNGMRMFTPPLNYQQIQWDSPYRT